MRTRTEYLDWQLQSLQERHHTIRNLPDEFVASIEDIEKAIVAVDKRCQQLVADLEEAHQEERLQLAELHELDCEYREQYVDHL